VLSAKRFPCNNLSILLVKFTNATFNFTDTERAGLAFFAGVLGGGRTYSLRLETKVYGFTASFSELQFITNLPPYGGACYIEPEIGVHSHYSRNVSSIKAHITIQI